MWRSKAGVSLLRSFIRSSSSSQSRPPLKTLTFDPFLPPKSNPSSLFSIPRRFSSSNDAASALEDDVRPIGSTNPVDAAADAETWNLGASDVYPVDFVGSVGFGKDADAVDETEEEGLSSLVEGSADGELGDEEGSVEEAPESYAEKVTKAQSVLRDSSLEQLESNLDGLKLRLSEEVVVTMLETEGVSAGNLIAFVKWTWKTDESVKTSNVLRLLVDLVCCRDNLEKMDGYKLWDLVKEFGGRNGLVTVEILNKLISMFSKLRKAKAGLEVFNDFDKFGCSANGESYYCTIEALSKISWSDTAWTICEKMLDSGNLPDGEKVGKIITFFCKEKKAKEAHLVYLMAKDKKIGISRADFDFLIGGLSLKDENVHLALQLLEDYPGESLKYANRSFGKVIRGLCKLKDIQGAKKLLLRMVDSGPAPGNAAFNDVITVLSKEGDLGDAVSLTKVMESRGLLPDIYTYCVIMNGYAKGGLMDEAYEIFTKAKKKHQKLKPVIYHILIRSYCKMENFDKALSCIKEMQEDGLHPDADAYNNIIHSLCHKALDWRTAEKLLEEMTERGLYLKGITRSLIAAVKELEEETQSGQLSLEA